MGEPDQGSAAAEEARRAPGGAAGRGRAGPRLGHRLASGTSWLSR